MPDLVKSIVRDGVQKILGVAFVWLVAHGVDVPADVRKSITNWGVLAAVAVLLLLWTTVVRALETRQGDGPVAAGARALGRVLMLGVQTVPTYQPTQPKPGN